MTFYVSKEDLPQLQCKVDRYLTSMKYENLYKFKGHEIYNIIHSELCRIITSKYKDIDPSCLMEFNVRRDSNSIEISGYIKLESKFIHIEHTCKKKGGSDHVKDKPTLLI